MNLENIKRLFLKKNRLSWKISVSVLWKKYKQYYMASRNFWTNEFLLIHWCNEFKQRQIPGWGQVQAQQNGNLMVEELNSRSFISMTSFNMGKGAWNITKALNPYGQILENSSRNFSKIFIFRVMSQTVYLENSSNFFPNFNFGVVS